MTSPRVPLAHTSTVVYSTAQVDSAAVEGLVMAKVDTFLASDEAKLARLPSGAHCIDVTSPALLAELELGGTLVNNAEPGWVLVSDGSGTPTAAGARSPGGFGVLAISRTRVFAILGSHRLTTSGAMEIAAALECTQFLCREGMDTRDALCISDYLTWVEARLGAMGYDNFRGKKNLPTWVALMASLLRWGGSNERNRYLHRVHVRSHVDGQRSWGQELNEVADRIAAAAKKLSFDTGSVNWVAPPEQHVPTVEAVLTALTGPYLIEEVEMAVGRRDTRALDAQGITALMVKAGGWCLRSKLTQEGNDAAYRGEYPVYRADGFVVGIHRPIGKKGGGNRHLTAPDSLQAIFSSIDASRILKALMNCQSICRAQKCNIPRLAGCMENVTLLMASIYDFHAGALKGVLGIGAQRVFLFSDISKAFDRVQLDLLIQAIRVVMGLVEGPALDRIIAKLVHLFDVGRVAVSKGRLTVLIAKKGGVHQGDPASPIVFAILMEYVRLLTPPDKRPHLKFHTSRDGDWLRMEIDYADDQIRATDSAYDMRILVACLRTTLASVGLEWNPNKVLTIALRVAEDGRVEVFDPHIPDGRGGYIKALTRDDFFFFLKRSLFISLKGYYPPGTKVLVCSNRLRREKDRALLTAKLCGERVARGSRRKAPELGPWLPFPKSEEASWH